MLTEFQVAMQGMDVDDVRLRAAHLNRLGADLATITAELRAIFDQGSTWVGHDAKSAVGQLNADVLPALNVAREFVEETARLMISSADQQEAASSGGVGAFE